MAHEEKSIASSVSVGGTAGTNPSASGESSGASHTEATGEDFDPKTYGYHHHRNDVYARDQKDEEGRSVFMTEAQIKEAARSNK